MDRFPLRVYLYAAALLGVGVALLLGAAWLRGVPAVQMLDDPASYYEYSPLSGIVSHAGIWLMVSTAAVCAFAARVGVRWRRLLAGVAAFSAYFAFDDLFMLHDAVWRRLGIPEEAIMLGFAAALLVILLAARAQAAPGRAWGLYMALALMGGSILIDMGPDRDATSDILNAIEDTLKFMSLGVWALFWMGVASGAVRLPEDARP
ncbi:MAG TPA: hypothetical protein PLL33_00185 [Paracoccus sp. (in: a-proteobacteria)]|nr:hypothetical protein [Paracoccus sp. (in: a-proteobacteria)]